MTEKHPLLLPMKIGGYDTNESRSSSRASSIAQPSPNPSEVLLNVEHISMLYDESNDLYDLYEEHEHDELSLLDPYFDMTSLRIRLIFDHIDKDKDSKVSYEEFRTSLAQLGIKCNDNESFTKFMKTIDIDNSQNITRDEFGLAVKRIKLLNLFQPATINQLIDRTYYEPVQLHLIDYSNKHIRRTELYSDKEIFQFFTTHRPSWATNRWLHLNGTDHLNVKRLAIKYSLHPLAVEDTLELHERPKVDSYEDHLFVVFPIIEIKKTMKSQLHEQPKRQRSNSLMYANFSGVSMATTIESEDFGLYIEHMAIFVIKDNTLITVKGGNASNFIWEDVNKRLNSSYSKLRHNDAKFLLYAVLDVIIDRMSHVMECISSHLMKLEEELEMKKHQFQMQKLRNVKNELFKLPRLLKPAREVLKNMIDSSEINNDTTAYIRDVHDHVVQILDEIELQWQLCRILTEDYREAKANQMNYVIYTLTIVTTVFLPAQFLTGVYGMNFDVMPELHEKYGYLMFWLLVIGIALSLQLYFRYKQWI